IICLVKIVGHQIAPHAFKSHALPVGADGRKGDIDSAAAGCAIQVHTDQPSASGGPIPEKELREAIGRVCSQICCRAEEEDTSAAGGHHWSMGELIAASSPEQA